MAMEPKASGGIASRRRLVCKSSEHLIVQLLQLTVVDDAQPARYGFQMLVTVGALDELQHCPPLLIPRARPPFPVRQSHF
jgi:hypothetical protein